MASQNPLHCITLLVGKRKAWKLTGIIFVISINSFLTAQHLILKPMSHILGDFFFLFLFLQITISRYKILFHHFFFIDKWPQNLRLSERQQKVIFMSMEGQFCFCSYSTLILFLCQNIIFVLLRLLQQGLNIKKKWKHSGIEKSCSWAIINLQLTCNMCGK